MSTNTMTDMDRFFWQQSADYATEIGRAISEHVRRGTPTTKVLDLLKKRIEGALNSLWVLHRHAPHEFGFDGMMVLRGVYDAHLQALYILAKPEESDARATLYLDFRWVERQRMKEMLEKNPTLFARTLLQSPKRAAAEPAIDAEFQRVRPSFLGPKGELHTNWYRGDLSALSRAEGVGLESEYRVLQRQLSSAVHSSAWSLLAPRPWVTGEQILLMAWRLVYRVLGRIAAHHGVPLQPEHEELVRDSFRNIFEPPDGGGSPPEAGTS